MQKNPTKISIEVNPDFLEDRSEPSEGRYAFSYQVTITNEGPRGAKLLNRHWIISSDNGRVQEVQGEGVVGEKPHLGVGHQFRYTSWVMLETPTGQMQGSYQFVSDTGDLFWAEIPIFLLEAPGKRTVH